MDSSSLQLRRSLRLVCPVPGCQSAAAHAAAPLGAEGAALCGVPQMWSLGKQQHAQHEPQPHCSPPWRGCGMAAEAAASGPTVMPFQAGCIWENAQHELEWQQYSLALPWLGC